MPEVLIKSMCFDYKMSFILAFPRLAKNIKPINQKKEWVLSLTFLHVHLFCFLSSISFSILSVAGQLAMQCDTTHIFESLKPSLTCLLPVWGSILNFCGFAFVVLSFRRCQDWQQQCHHFKEWRLRHEGFTTWWECWGRLGHLAEFEILWEEHFHRNCQSKRIC